MSDRLEIPTAARDSPLSRAQLKEIQNLLPNGILIPVFVKTHGDLNRTTSLRTLSKCDFFTREVDHLVTIGKCRLAIHSAKDLPEKIPEDLCLAALTKGIDNRDALVLKKGITLNDLPPFPMIATSSEKRELAVRQLLPNAKFCDVRGTIAERLALLDQNLTDGVVIAEAALIRLDLTHLSRFYLPGKTTDGQGQLALIIKKDDRELQTLLTPLDSRIG